MAELSTALQQPMQQPLALHHWPSQSCYQQQSTPPKPPLVLLHGWGNSSQTWRTLRPLLQQHLDLIAVDLPGFGDSPASTPDFDCLLQWLGQQLPDRFHLLGWSLGGMVATAFAGRYGHRVASLTTIATNASFIQRPGWSRAMAVPVFEQFVSSFHRDAPTSLRRFAGLQSQGDERERALLRELRRTGQGTVNGDWHTALSWLGQLDNRSTLADLAVPCLHLLGEQDALVPAAVAGDLLAGNPGARVEILPGSAHVPHLGCPALLAPIIIDFLQADPHRLDKHWVAESFGRAAAGYDAVAHLQRQTGEQLLAGLDTGTRPEAIIDIGCGTGLFAERLQRHYPGSCCLGLDLAEGMIRYCRQQRHSGQHWLCGDAEQLPLADGSIDLAFSNFTFQWCQNIDAVMTGLARVLRSEGKLVFSTIGPASLRELRAAWREVDGFTHVNRFTAIEAIRQALVNAGFRIHRFDVTEQVQYYRELGDLTRELKALGAHNVTAGRNTGLTGRQRILQLKRAYERLRTAQGLPASWEILQVVATRS